MTKIPKLKRSLGVPFGIWSLDILWTLELGYWDLSLGISSSYSNQSSSCSPLTR